jgi:hypothetical protein
VAKFAMAASRVQRYSQDVKDLAKPLEETLAGTWEGIPYDRAAKLVSWARDDMKDLRSFFTQED